MGSFQGLMDIKLAYRLIDEMAEHLPMILVPFFRGESLLHPDWWRIIEYAHQKGIGPIQFTTNGTLLDEANARHLLDCGVDFMSFSLDTLDPALYEASRRGANYDRTHANILRFLEMHRAESHPMIIQVSAVETEAHKAGMQAFVDYWLPRVNRVRVYAEHSSDGNPGSMQEHIASVTTRKPCKKVDEDMVILWNGDVAICNHDWQRQRNHDVFADVREHGISAAWQSEGYKQLREAHAEGNLEGFRPCQDCEQWKAFYLPDHVIGRAYTRD